MAHMKNVQKLNSNTLILKTLRGYATTSVYQQGLEKKLFTPGPLGTHADTRTAMQIDYGSRDRIFRQTIKDIRDGLVKLAALPADKYTCVPMQGAGTYGLESVVGTTVPRNGRMLICSNGAYGDRIKLMADALGIDYILNRDKETEPTNVGKVQEILTQNTDITNVTMVHCETTTGVFNPIHDVGTIIRQCAPNASFFVDAMSSFGAVPIDMQKSSIHFLVSSANKCTEGVPGFSFIIANIDKLLKCEGQARSLSLNALNQYKALEKDGMFPYTPPTHVMMAFKKALDIHFEEGGVEGRAKRYQNNRNIVKEGMREMGFKELLKESHQGYIITSFYFPDDPNFDFDEFYTRLSDKGQVIYPGKVTDAACFRIGNIGQLYADDMRTLLKSIKEVCTDMNITLPLKQ